MEELFLNHLTLFKFLYLFGVPILTFLIGLLKEFIKNIFNGDGAKIYKDDLEFPGIVALIIFLVVLFETAFISVVFKI